MTPLPYDRRLRLAQSLGYEIHAGRKHWQAIHSATAQVVIIPFGARTAAHNERNLLSELRRKARPTVPNPFARFT
jgi:hypothetical protein